MGELRFDHAVGYLHASCLLVRSRKVPESRPPSSASTPGRNYCCHPAGATRQGHHGETRRACSIVYDRPTVDPRAALPSLFGLALVACTPTSPPRQEEPPTPEPSVAPMPVDAGAPETATRCLPRFAQDPATITSPPIEPTPLSTAATWSQQVDAIGGYEHGVGLDAEGHVVWAHDTKHMHFAVERFDRDGHRQWQRILEPRQLEPEALHVTPDGAILVAGTSFAEGAAGGQLLVTLEPTRTERWRQRTPRVSVHALSELAQGHTLMQGSSGRQEVTLGGHLMRNEWLPRGHSMDIVARLDGAGEYLWSTAFLPGVLGMAVQGEAFYLAGNFGDTAVDYGTGPTAGPGVLARFELETGRNAWSIGLPTGLRAVLPQGDDLLVVGFGHGVSMGGPVLEGTPAAWFDPDGCYRGSVSLGSGMSRIVAGPDGSLVLYGMAPIGPATHSIGTTSFEVPAGHWFVAGIDPALELRWLHTVRCDGLHAAAGPRGRAAFSCYSDVSRPGKLVRRYELFVLGE